MASNKFMLSIDVSRMFLCRYSGLTSSEIIELNEQEPFNVYMILKGRKILANQNKLKIEDDGICLKVTSIKRENKQEGIVFFPVDIPNLKTCRIEIPYPFDMINVFDSEDKLITGGHLSTLLRNYRGTLNYNKKSDKKFDFLDLELLYVGQSQGKKKKRDSLDRLDVHSTYLKILGLESENDPNCEIFVGLCHYDTEISMITLSGEESDTEKDVKALMKLREIENYRSQVVNLLEASLISYFLPKYNDKFKKEFPSQGHTSYHFFYEAGIHTCFIKFTPLDYVNCGVYTENRKKVYHDSFSFKITGTENGIGPFEFFKNHSRKK